MTAGSSGLGFNAGAAGLNTAGVASTVPVGTSLASMPASMTAASTAGKGLIGTIMASPYTAPALISGGTQLIGGVMQGYGMQKQQEEQQKLAGEERNRYNRNIGTRLWG